MLIKRDDSKPKRRAKKDVQMLEHENDYGLIVNERRVCTNGVSRIRP